MAACPRPTAATRGHLRRSGSAVRRTATTLPPRRRASPRRVAWGHRSRCPGLDDGEFAASVDAVGRLHRITTPQGWTWDKRSLTRLPIWQTWAARGGIPRTPGSRCACATRSWTSGCSSSPPAFPRIRGWPASGSFARPRRACYQPRSASAAGRGRGRPEPALKRPTSGTHWQNSSRSFQRRSAFSTPLSYEKRYLRRAPQPGKIGSSGALSVWYTGWRIGSVRELARMGQTTEETGAAA